MATATTPNEYKITKHIGVLSEGSRGWQKEVNLVSWNSKPAKIDIRDWAPQHEKMGKGTTLTVEEAHLLCQYLYTYCEEAE
jgi:hypothetical protein